MSTASPSISDLLFSLIPVALDYSARSKEIMLDNQRREEDWARELERAEREEARILKTQERDDAHRRELLSLQREDKAFSRQAHEDELAFRRESLASADRRATEDAQLLRERETAAAERHRELLASLNARRAAEDQRLDDLTRGSLGEARPLATGQPTSLVLDPPQPTSRQPSGPVTTCETIGSTRTCVTPQWRRVHLEANKKANDAKARKDSAFKWSERRPGESSDSYYARRQLVFDAFGGPLEKPGGRDRLRAAGWGG